jgi:hypothetical protein
MSDLININIDLAKLQGAEVREKNGKHFLMIDLSESRVKHYPRSNGKDSAYCSLEIKASDKLKDEKTHLVKESRTKDERQQRLELPILGDGREFNFNKSDPVPERKPVRPNAPNVQLGYVAPVQEDDGGFGSEEISF